ncbi:Predicted phospholipase, patatin/cPLA2 family [Caloranaerobacter azorensis DSM 13643]|uniref:Predicted phospholipase, patatin/cPLA2 family n=1 Tax=Caloranaerobacter azorensis DSM 13643 TaxID=1121264 RepID=A0A1M5S784_9FIRM|nr:patatin family protein [Caloranaerobacter azorensis]SHH34364.1 Predicted phospholipase, patatin/cPLA2 family [Caloranaerobacter azorensis DSM 13643]
MLEAGLVLEGGGMRGCYTSGVLDFFMEKDLYFPYIIGVSAGACNASSYISRQKGRSIKINLDYAQDDRYISYKNLIIKRSLFGMDFIFDEIPNKLIPFDFETFNEAKEKFIIVATDCKTGQPVYFDKDECEDVVKAIKASSSLPFVAPIVEMNGKFLLDGGIADPLPIKKSIEDGNKKNVIVLTRNKGYRKSPFKLRKLLKVMYSEYPGLINAMLNRYKVYNSTLEYIEKLESEKKVFVIRPTKNMKVDRIERDVNKLKELYEMGYEDAKRCYDEMMNWICEE